MVFGSMVLSGGWSRAYALAFLSNTRAEAPQRIPRRRSWTEPQRSLAESLAGVPALLSLSAVNFRVIVEGRQRELNPGLYDEIYRIGREAIINAHRHSGATVIEAQLQYGRSELQILIRDNGCGIDPENLQRGRNGNWGLLGMRERAERIGARLRVRSRTAMGTEVELRVPGRSAFQQACTAAAR